MSLLKNEGVTRSCCQGVGPIGVWQQRSGRPRSFFNTPFILRSAQWGLLIFLLFFVEAKLQAQITIPPGPGPVPGGCSTNNDCNDQNPCTVDACSFGMCLHANQINGTSCSDKNICNG